MERFFEQVGFVCGFSVVFVFLLFLCFWFVSSSVFFCTVCCVCIYMWYLFLDPYVFVDVVRICIFLCFYVAGFLLEYLFFRALFRVELLIWLYCVFSSQSERE